MRDLSHRGVAEHAGMIAREVNVLGKVISTHLATEDRILYPMMERVGDADMVQLSRTYQQDMEGIAGEFIRFVHVWEKVDSLKKDPEEFRRQANITLRKVFERMKREDREFYPAVEATRVH